MNDTQIQNLELVLRQVHAMQHVPFRHRGRYGMSDGVDCAGLVIAGYAAAGVALEDDPSYRTRPRPEVLEACLMASGFEPIHDPMDGDVVQACVDGIPRHCGILEGQGFWHVVYERSVEWTPFSADLYPVARYWRYIEWQH